MILPDAGRPPFATYYLLHGLSGGSSGGARLWRPGYWGIGCSYRSIDGALR